MLKDESLVYLYART